MDNNHTVLLHRIRALLLLGSPAITCTIWMHDTPNTTLLEEIQLALGINEE